MLARSGITLEEFPQNTVIYDPKSYRRSLGILVYGSALVSKNVGGHRIIMSRLTPGSLFGAAALFNQEAVYLTEIKTDAPTSVIFLPQSVVRQLFQKDFRLVENYLTYLAERIRFLNQRIGNFTQSDSTGKVLQYLEEHAHGRTFTLNMSWTAFAQALGISRASLYRILEELEDVDCIARSHKTITLLTEKVEK